ncbi:hypothetical protein [Pseudomonas eucalypticola]|uniref:Uncharacterized protein n=1 Tax=Pseudomonas eucalypticola TaxID=2599595 RepID=A0A7D5D519_9PSED|nr:hypothetical protein [Pseudomonas eucalypticola]QKZ03279.1 hypothetical protein HWQ56_05555 [Pseudomonas eucalypticola]
MAEINPVTAELAAQINDLANQGLELLGLTAATPPEDVVAAITQRVRDCKAAGTVLPEEQTFALGALLGNQYVLGHDWHWGGVVWDFDEENGAVGVLNHDDSLFMNPIGWVAETLESEGGVGFMLNYNLVAANEVPVRDPGSATGLY